MRRRSSFATAAAALFSSPPALVLVAADLGAAVRHPGIAVAALSRPPIADAREFAPPSFLFRRPRSRSPPSCGEGGAISWMRQPASGGSAVTIQGAGGGDGHEGGGTTTSGGGNGESLRRAIEDLARIVDPAEDPRRRGAATRPSMVHIVGTGLTPTLMDLPLSALRLLSRADAVLHDSLGLPPEEVRRIVPDHCDIVCVGKRGDAEGSWRQSDIDRLLLQKASEPPGGRCIVRLKGGDPFLFGRTRTEIDALRSSGVPYTYTPGLSSCVAGPHLGGIPLTDALMGCQSFGVWSGTDAFGRSRGLGDEGGDDAGPDGRWHGPWGVDVLVFLMIGRLDKLDALCRYIENCGDYCDDVGRWNKGTPCAVIQNAGGAKEADESTTLPVQKVWRSTLGNIVKDIKEEDPTRSSVSPAVFVVGATASLDLLSQDSQYHESS